MRVQDGTFDENVERSEGMVTGAGDGMDDMVPAIEGEQDVPNDGGSLYLLM